MKRLTLVLAVVGLLLSATPVAAARPERVFLEAPPPTDYPVGQLCTFPVRIEVIVNKEYSLTFAAADDATQRAIVTGRLVVKVTNLVTGESLTANVSGPGVFTFAPDGTLSIDGTGRWLFYLFPGDVGGPGVWVATGRFHLEAGETGITVLEMPHQTLDVCAALAA